MNVVGFSYYRALPIVHCLYVLNMHILLFLIGFDSHRLLYDYYIKNLSVLVKYTAFAFIGFSPLLPRICLRDSCKTGHQSEPTDSGPD